MTAQQVLDLIDAIKWPIVVIALGLMFRHSLRKSTGQGDKA
jgi:hypothetical protein